MEVWTANFPTGALGVRLNDECSFCRSHQQKKVSLLDINMLHTVQNRGCGSAAIDTWIICNDHRRLNGFQCCLNFTGALVSLHRLFGEAALDNGPETGRHWRAERLRQFAHDGGADLKASAPFKWKPTGSRFIKHNPEGPQITAIICSLAAQDFRRHIRQRTAYR